MSRIRTSSRYAIDRIGMDPLSLGELGGCQFEKCENCGMFKLRRGDHILMKFNI